MTKNLVRCPWCGDDPLYLKYHDEEWGKEVHDDRKLFEFLILEGAQAGLSWITVLRKRENYRKAFFDWDIERIAEMNDEELEKILLNPGVIRNRLKVYSVRKNAIVTLEIQKEFGSLDAYFWNLGWIRHREEGSDPVKQKGILLNGLDYFVNSQGQPGSFSSPFPIISHPDSMRDLVPETEVSKKISKDLKKRGMSFVGSTIIYAFMQATGMVDDHIESCSFKSR